MPPQNPVDDNRFVPDIVTPQGQDDRFIPDEPFVADATPEPTATPEQKPSLFKRAYDFATTSVTGMEEPTLEDWTKNPKTSAFKAGVIGMTTPLALGSEVLGGLGLLKGASKLGILGKAAPKAGEVAEEIKPVTEEIKPQVLKPDFVKMAEERFSAPIKPGEKLTAEIPTNALAKVEPEAPRMAGFVNSGGGVGYIQFDRIGPEVTVNDIKKMFPGRNIQVTRFSQNILSPHLQKFRIDAFDESGRMSSKVLDDMEKEVGGNFIDWQKAGEKLYDKTHPADIAPKEPTQLKLPNTSPQELAVQPPEVIQKLTNAIDEGLAKAKEQAASITKQKGARIAAAKQVTTPGEKGFYQQLGKLKGEYDKLGMPPLREVLDQNDIDSLVDIISNSPIDDEFTKIHAKSGLVKLLNGQIPQPSELNLLNNILQTSIEVPGAMKVPANPSRLRQIYELTRGLISTDVPFMTSAAFRQGAPMAGTRQWFQAFKDQARSFPSEKVYDTIMEGIEANPIHRKRVVMTPSGETQFQSIADQIGLASSDLKTLSSREEQIRGIIAEKLPGMGRWIRASNRSFTAFINSLRTSTAYDWLKAADAIDAKGNITNLEEAQKIANTINELTGHGSLKIAAPFSRFTKSGRELNLEKSADALSLIFFSPRNMARDARMMNPLNYMKNDKVVRLQYLNGALRRAGVWAGFTGLGALAGAQVVADPTNADFGKIKMGDTRADAGSGLLQWITLTARQALGGSTSSTRPGRFTEFGSNPVAPTREEVFKDFMENRLHPSLRPLVDFATATKNRPFYPLSEAGEAIAPFPVADMIELMKSDPEAAQIAIGLAASGLSMGSQTYGRSDYGKPQFDIPGDVAFKGGSLLSK